MIDMVALSASVLFQFLGRKGHQPELNLLRCKLKENLLGALVHPFILPAPHKVYMVWHDDKAVEPYPFVVDHKLQAVYQNIFPLIGQQQRLPVEAGGCEKFNTLMHTPSYEKKVGAEKKNGR